MKPWKVASLILIVLAVAAAGYGSILVRRGFSALETPSAIEEFAATTARKIAVPSAYRQIRNHIMPSTENIRASMAHFSDHCATCHSNDGGGQTGFTDWGNFSGLGGRADTVPGVSPYAGQSINQWINPAAFADPCANCQTLANGVTTAIGRFGDESSGSIVGPGTQAVSLSLLKRFSIKERIQVVVGMQVANAFNHPNYNVPSNLTIGAPAFGQITSMQNTEGAGRRRHLAELGPTKLLLLREHGLNTMHLCPVCES